MAKERTEGRGKDTLLVQADRLQHPILPEVAEVQETQITQGVVEVVAVMQLEVVMATVVVLSQRGSVGKLSERLISPKPSSAVVEEVAAMGIDQT